MSKLRWAERQTNITTKQGFQARLQCCVKRLLASSCLSV